MEPRIQGIVQHTVHDPITAPPRDRTTTQPARQEPTRRGILRGRRGDGPPAGTSPFGNESCPELRAVGR